MTSPAADRPQYADGTPVRTDVVDSSTAEFSRGLNPKTGAKGPEPAEPRPTLTGLNPAGGPAAGGTAVVAAGDNFGGSTGVTVGGAAATAFRVVSERELRFTTPAGVAGAAAVVVLNPAGNSVGGPTFAYA